MDYTPKFSKIVKVTAKDFYATGSEKGASDFLFLVQVDGDTVLSTPHGETIAASEFQKEVYEIGLSRVSGSV